MRLVSRSMAVVEVVAVLAVLAAAIALVPRGSSHSEAAQLSSSGYTTNASVSPDPAAPGTARTITAMVTAASAGSVLVDIEVYGPGGRVHQQFFDGQSFAAGQQRSFTSNWNARSSTPTATYTVKIGIFSPG